MPNAPQVAAVTQTLAGERMTYTINFPTTGDTDCDLIQGVLAVVNAMGYTLVDTYVERIALVLRFMADRYDLSRAHAQDVSSKHDLANLVHRQQALEQHMIQMENLVIGPLNPYTTSAGLTASQQIAASHASAMGMSPHQQMSQSDELDKLCSQLMNTKQP